MVRIMTDNAANLPKHLLEQYGIGELCLTYTIDGQPADISAEFDGRSFYEAMRHGAVVQTSMVTPDAARREMEPHLKNGDDVLYIGLSSGVSGTCWGVGLVAKELAEEYPDRKIRVLNSRGASLGEGLIVLAAAKLAAEGRVIEEIEVRCEELCGKMRQHFMVDELKFLRKGGRISGGAALAGTLLQIKPILEGDEEGKIVMLSKVRGKKAGIEEFQKVLKEFALEDCSKYEVGDKEDCNTYDFCVPLGIGYDFGHLTFDVRYQQGTVDVIKGDDEKTLNTLLCFNFGYKF